ncbi:MAG TPA: ATP-binding protein [Methyloceanibacter sp.]|nr:ATP-binding protein [Methyloceanibacter sp.]
MSRISSAQQPLFAIAAPIWQGLRGSVSGHLPKTELLRRAVPVLVALFASLAAIGLVTQTLQSRQSAFDLAEERLALMADLTASRLKDEPLKPDSSWQAALAASLPKGAALDERTALLADGDGTIQARAPLMTSETASLLAILGPQQPLTTFGADAGVLRMTLVDGSDAFVTVRDLPEKNAQIAFIQPVHAALSGWRWDASLEITLLICTGLVLALLGGGVWYLTPAEVRKDNVAGHLTEALSACPVWRWNLARGHVHWSGAMYRLLGRPPVDETMAFRSIAQSLHPDDDLRASIDRHLRSGRMHFDQNFRLRHADGHWVTMRLRGHITRDKETAEPLLTAIAAAEQQESAASPDANARLRDAVETISEAFVLWDNQNRLVMCNSKYQQFHGLPDAAIRPGTTYEAVIAAVADPVIRKRIKVDGGEGEESCTYEAQLEDGRWLHINERRTRDGGYVSVGTDITILKESQQRLADSEQQLRASVTELRLSRRELEQQKQQLVDLAEKYALEKNRAEAANRAKSEFLANISHELRTPLNAVIGFSEVMEQGLFGPLGHAKYREYARDIHQSGTYLLEVINDVLDMSKIEAGRMALDIDNVDVADIVEDSMKVVAQAAADRDIALSRHGPSKLMVEADRRALKQVFLNLLSNAVKFTRDGGSVDVHLSRTRGLVRIAIKDTGIGIPEADIVKLGRPFEQVENQFSKSHQGSGLGLAISRALVELHGGSLQIKSREGQGTTVTCTLPIKAVAEQDEDEAATA